MTVVDSVSLWHPLFHTRLQDSSAAALIPRGPSLALTCCLNNLSGYLFNYLIKIQCFVTKELFEQVPCMNWCIFHIFRTLLCKRKWNWFCLSFWTAPTEVIKLMIDNECINECINLLHVLPVQANDVSWLFIPYQIVYELLLLCYLWHASRFKTGMCIVNRTG